MIRWSRAPLYIVRIQRLLGRCGKDQLFQVSWSARSTGAHSKHDWLLSPWSNHVQGLNYLPPSFGLHSAMSATSSRMPNPTWWFAWIARVDLFAWGTQMQLIKLSLFYFDSYFSFDKIQHKEISIILRDSSKL